MKTQKFFKKGTRLLFLSTEKEVPEINDKINDLVQVSDSICVVDDVTIVVDEFKQDDKTQKNNIEPRYNPITRKIHLPEDYSKGMTGVFPIVKEKLGNLFEEAVGFHECGHAVEHLGRKNLSDIEIHSFSSLSRLFNGLTNKCESNKFLIETFKEGYADCYSCLCLFKKYKNIEVFDYTYEARKKRFEQLKEKNGKHYIESYFNYDSPLIFKEIIQNLQQNGIDILSLPYKNDLGVKNCIEQHLEEAVVKGCLKALTRELENNDAFLNDFRQYTQKAVTDFPIKNNSIIEQYIKANGLNSKEIIQSLNQDGLVPYFLEFQRRSNQCCLSNENIESLLNNNKLFREVDTNLKLMEIKPAEENYSKFQCPEKPKISLNIQNIRDNALHINNNDNKLKFIS